MCNPAGFAPGSDADAVHLAAAGRVCRNSIGAETHIFIRLALATEVGKLRLERLEPHFTSLTSMFRLRRRVLVGIERDDAADVTRPSARLAAVVPQMENARGLVEVLFFEKYVLDD